MPDTLELPQTAPQPAPAQPQPQQQPPKRGKMTVINLEKFRSTVLFSISLCRWGNSMKVTDVKALEQYIADLKLAKAEAKAKAGESDGNEPLELKAEPAVFLATDRVKSTKTLIRSKKYDRLRSAMNQLKSRVESKAMPSYFRTGMFVCKQENVAEVEAMIQQGWQAIQDNELADFIKDYPQDIERARQSVKEGGLGPLFREADYPDAEAVKATFNIEWYWMAISVPENIPDALKAEAQEKFKRRMADAAQQIEQALRGEFLELISHAEEKLTTAPGEKPKIFRDSLIGNVIEFLNTFDSRNMFGDERMTQVIAQARAALIDQQGNSKLKAQALRDFPNVREEARKRFATIREAMSGMIEEQGRLIQFDE